jgi:predicted NAD-dependent protein-ADP-ribosyltransferase YbiA (DUF1768 family)
MAPVGITMMKLKAICMVLMQTDMMLKMRKLLMWGVCRGVGKNYLGRLLMLVREEARYNEE